MTTIRPLERSDLAEVTSLYELAYRSGTRSAPPGLEEYFERTLLEQPWVDPEIPSLVYVDESGAVSGFLGSSVRRLDFDGEPVRLAVSGQLVADPKARSRAAGAFLMKAYLAGPQDLTITDGATEEVRRMWVGLGGETRHLECIGWIRAFRPWVAAAQLVEGPRPRLARVLRPVAPALDATTRAASSWLEATEPAGTREELTPELVVEHLPQVARHFRLRPAYDLDFIRRLLPEVEAVRNRGTLVRQLVRLDSGDVAGWFVYYATKGYLGYVRPDRLLRACGRPRARPPLRRCGRSRCHRAPGACRGARAGAALEPRQRPAPERRHRARPLEPNRPATRRPLRPSPGHASRRRVVDGPPSLPVRQIAHKARARGLESVRHSGERTGRSG